MSTFTYWTTKEEATLRRMKNEGKSREEISKVLKRTVKSVSWKIAKLGLAGTTDNYLWWSDEEWEEAQRLRHDEKLTYDQVAAKLNLQFGNNRYHKAVEAKFYREKKKVKDFKEIFQKGKVI